LAKTGDTSITKTQAVNFARDAANMAELSCDKIKGFHLVKTQKGATWRLRYTDFSGKRRKLSLGKLVDGTSDRMRAVDLAQEYRGELSKGKDPVAEITKLKAKFKTDSELRESRLLRAYLEGPYKKHQAKKKDGGRHTLDLISRAFSDLLDTPMDAITKKDLANWQEKYRIGNDGKIRAHSTTMRSFSALRTLLRHAVQHGAIDVDPTTNFKLSSEADEDKEKRLNGDALVKRRMLTAEELTGISQGIALYKADLISKRENSRKHGQASLPSLENLVHPHWFFPFFRLAAYTGMRPGDLYSLNWQELNLTFSRLVKVPNKTRHHGNPSKLDLPLDQHITEIMDAWHKQLGSPVNGLVFPSPVNGNKMDKKAHIRHWKAVLQLGEITSDIDFYSLRHHYISKLVANSVPLFTVARLAGHKSTKMIEEHYGHLAPHAAAEALSLISGDFVNTQSSIKNKIEG
jgi:integrase